MQPASIRWSLLCSRRPSTPPYTILIFGIELRLFKELGSPGIIMGSYFNTRLNCISTSKYCNNAQLMYISTVYTNSYTIKHIIYIWLRPLKWQRVNSAYFRKSGRHRGWARSPPLVGVSCSGTIAQPGASSIAYGNFRLPNGGAPMADDERRSSTERRSTKISAVARRYSIRGRATMKRRTALE